MNDPIKSDSFYVTLPSNVKTQGHERKIGSYVTHLASKLELSKDWMVGLCEIMYTNSWFNLTADSTIRIVSTVSRSPHTSWSRVPAGRYPDIQSLIEMIESLNFVGLKDREEIPKLVPNTHANNLMMKQGHRGSVPTIFEFGKELAHLIGAEEGFFCCQEIGGIDYYQTKGTYDLSTGVDGLYVYCDIVEYSIVGNARVQLLRLVKTKDAKFGERIDIVYDKPYYQPVFTNEISSIEIDVKDGTNRTIDFKFGRLEIVLHFIRQPKL